MPTIARSDRLIAEALRIAHQGWPYVWGGDGKQKGGYDCSGFTKAVYAVIGVYLPRTAQTQYDRCKQQGTLGNLAHAQPGDLIFFNNPYSKKVDPVGHVGIYRGPTQLLMAAVSKGVSGYAYGPYWKGYTVAFGRPS